VETFPNYISSVILVGDEDTDLDDNIDKLESELMDAIAKKQAGQNVIDGYRRISRRSYGI